MAKDPAQRFARGDAIANLRDALQLRPAHRPLGVGEHLGYGYAERRRNQADKEIEAHGKEIELENELTKVVQALQANPGFTPDDTASGFTKAVIAKLKDPEHKLEVIRAELRTEEKTAVNSAQSADQKKQIRKQYQDLIKILSGDIKADKNTIKQVEQQKKLTEKLVKEAYAAKIKELENEIKLLEMKGGGKPKR